MQKMFVIAAALAAAASPVFAQTSPEQAGAAQATPTAEASAEQPKMVTKVVCKKVEEERSIGSRLSSTSKVCRKVTMPASDSPEQAQQPKRGH